MADESEDQGVKPSVAVSRPASSPPAPPAEAKPQEDVLRLTRAGWQERASAFRVSRHAIAGALYARKEDELLSADDVRAALDEFSERTGVEQVDE